MTDLISFLASESGLSREDIDRIVRTAPKRYKVYLIPKRSGGFREIAQPAREVKLLQRIFVERYLEPLPVHECATAYEPGRNLRDNLLPHLGDKPILKMDFQDFFPSIHGADWIRYCSLNHILSPEERKQSANILFRLAKGERTLKLSIGAPSSPRLCNVLMYRFDTAVSDAAQRRKISYTRYADDLTFSSQRIGMLKDMTKEVEFATRNSGILALRLNRTKTKFITRKNRRTVTGLNITNDGKISIGRENKRRIQAQVHHALKGDFPPSDVGKLLGMLSYVNSVEPSFIDRLNRKYECNVVHILKARAGT